MAQIKSYTDISQSKKLAKILPLESADMFHFIHGNINSVTTGIGYGKASAEFYSQTKHEYIPCWSLAALLCVIPKHIKDYNVLRIDMNEDTFAIWYDEIGFGVNAELPNITNESAIDACVEMIIKLNELKML